MVTKDQRAEKKKLDFQHVLWSCTRESCSAFFKMLFLVIILLYNMAGW